MFVGNKRQKGKKYKKGKTTPECNNDVIAMMERRISDLELASAQTKEQFAAIERQCAETERANSGLQSTLDHVSTL